MPVSQRDRDYFARLGEAEAEAQADRRAEHLALDLGERLRRSEALALRFWSSANLSQRVDDPCPFYERAKQLGLYRG